MPRGVIYHNQDHLQNEQTKDDPDAKEFVRTVLVVPKQLA